MYKITKKLLLNWMPKPCGSQARLFDRTFPHGMDVTRKNLEKAQQVGLDLVWYINHHLGGRAWEEYRRIIAPAEAKYRRVKDRALFEHGNELDKAWEMYVRPSNLNWEEYRREEDLAGKKYNRITTLAWEVLQRVRGETAIDIILRFPPVYAGSMHTYAGWTADDWISLGGTLVAICDIVALVILLGTLAERIVALLW